MCDSSSSSLSWNLGMQTTVRSWNLSMQTTVSRDYLTFLFSTHQNSPERILLVSNITSLTLLPSSFFSESVVVFSLFPPSFSPCVLFLSLVYWPFRTRLLACLIRAAVLHFSCRLQLFTSRYFVTGSPD